MNDELRELRQQLAMLQKRLSELERRDEAPPVHEPPALAQAGDQQGAVRGHLRRRDLLRHVPVAAAGVVAAGAAGTLLAQPAAASDGGAIIQGAVNNGTKTTTIQTNGNVDSAPALTVYGGVEADEIDTIASISAGGGIFADNAVGAESLTVSGSAPSSGETAVAARFHGAVNGKYGDMYGAAVIVVDGITGPLVDIDLQDGITGNANGAPHNTPGTGIRVRGSHLATGIDIAVGSGAPAIQAAQTDATSTSTVVTATNVGTGRTVNAESTSTKSYNAVITGTANGPGTGVWGQHNGPTGQGIVGVSTHGVGGRFQGGAANLRLIPATASTHPTTGVAGYIFVDSTARLWYCTKSSSGSLAATWKQLA